MRYRELDIFKILGIFLEIVLNFWDFLRKFFRIFGRNFLGIFEKILEDFFGRNVLSEIFARILFGGIYLEESFWRRICLSRFWFLSRFCLKARRKEEKFQSLEVRVQAYRIQK